jgi:hypothetical protein
MDRAARIAFVAAACFSFVMAVLPHPPAIPGQPSDKLTHIAAFLTLGALAACGFPRHSVSRLFLFLSGFGAVIELVQATPALHRDSDVFDLLTDMAAALFALGLARWVMRRRSRG